MTVHSGEASAAATASISRPVSSRYSLTSSTSSEAGWPPPARSRERRVAVAATNSWPPRSSPAAIRGFWSGPPWAISRPLEATTIANPSWPTRIRATIRHSSSRLTSPTSQPSGSPSLVIGSETVVVGRKSSSRVIGAMTEGSTVRFRGSCRVGPPSRLVATTARSASNSVNSRNSSKSSTWLVRITVCCHGSSWVSWRSAAIDRSTLTWFPMYCPICSAARAATLRFPSMTDCRVPVRSE